MLLQTKVYFISPQIDTGTQSVLVKAPADKAADVLRAMQLVRARIVWSTHSGITVPVVAVIARQRTVLRLCRRAGGWKAGGASAAAASWARSSGNDYAVLSGLKAGDQVVVSGGQNLADGVPVKIEQ